MSIEDLEAEKTVLAGIIRHGRDAFIDADAWVVASDFTDQGNQLIYTCLKRHYDDGEDRAVDFPTLMSLAKRCGVADRLGMADETRHIRGIFNTSVELSTVEPESQKLARLRAIRDVSLILGDADHKLHRCSGDESLSSVFALIEDPLNEYISTLGASNSEGARKLGQNSREWFLEKLRNPNQNIGIPSPFPKYNAQIGGGFRPSTVSLIAARLKTGKSSLGVHIGIWVARTLGIPVLFVDTEMTEEEHKHKVIANLSGVEIHKIETSTTDDDETEKVLEACDLLDSIPYHYESVIQKTFDEQMASVRRWAVKTLKPNEDGSMPPCLVIYDYLKIADKSDFKKDLSTTESMGVNMLTLMRIASKFSLSVLSFLQLNRDGEVNDSASAIATSDMPARSGANVGLFKRKDRTQIERDGEENGTHYIIVTDARHGPGGRDDEISMHFEGQFSRITEGKTRSEIRKSQGTTSSRTSTFSKGEAKGKGKPKLKLKKEEAPDHVDLERELQPAGF